MSRKFQACPSATEEVGVQTMATQVAPSGQVQNSVIGRVLGFIKSKVTLLATLMLLVIVGVVNATPTYPTLEDVQLPLNPTDLVDYGISKIGTVLAVMVPFMLSIILIFKAIRWLFGGAGR